MPYVYAAFSEALNRISIESSYSQYWLFKFGFCREGMELQDRFNIGFRKHDDDPSLPRRTLPLALCEDWHVVKTVETGSTTKARAVEALIHEWCEARGYRRFALHNEIVAEVRRRHKCEVPSWTYSGNGIGEIRCVDGSKEPRLLDLLRIHRFNDPLGATVMRHVLAFLEGELTDLAEELFPDVAFRTSATAADDPRRGRSS